MRFETVIRKTSTYSKTHGESYGLIMTVMKLAQSPNDDSMNIKTTDDIGVIEQAGIG